MQVTLDIQNKNHWEALVPLLKEFNITFQVANENGISREEQDKKDWEIIMKGAHDDNFEEFYAQWKEDRKDPPQLFRD